MNNLTKRILEASALYDDNVPSSVNQEPGAFNPVISNGEIITEKQLRNETSKDSIEPQIAPFKKKSDTRVPPKFAKSKDDLKEEFEVIEIPMIMKEYENWLLDNPGKSFKEFLREQNLINESLKKQYEDMVLSGALAKIDNVMSGIMTIARGGLIKDPAYSYFSDGGSSKNKPKDPVRSVRKLNLADYFQYGMRIADLTNKEREVVNDLLKKTFSKTSNNN